MRSGASPSTPAASCPWLTAPPSSRTSSPAAPATPPDWAAGAWAARYAVSLVVWIMGLSRIEVSIAYPLLSLGYVINAAAAWYLFGESLTVMRVAGIGLIIAGVFLVARTG